MFKHHPTLLEAVEAYLALSKMGETYFGKKAVGNSELVPRLRAGGSVLVTTDEKVRRFMADNPPVSPEAVSCPGNNVTPATTVVNPETIGGAD